ncbi:MAG: 4Fe-4S binding protein, partial [Candidatus Methanomethylophilaceae archaeon]
ETAITVDDIAVIDADKCIDCGTCVDECPNSAITE